MLVVHEKLGVAGPYYNLANNSNFLNISVSGEILVFNEELITSPDLVNSSPFDKGWIVKMKLSNPAELDELLTSQAYGDLIA